MGWTLLLNWRTYAVLGYVALAAWGAIQTKRLEWAKTDFKVLQAQFDGFKAQVAAEGRIAQQKADLQAKQDLERKEKADAQNKATVTLLNQRIASLRHDLDSRSSYSLPPADPASKRPDLICFDRTELSRADGAVLGRLREIADKGDSATVDLNSARTWAAGR